MAFLLQIMCYEYFKSERALGRETWHGKLMHYVHYRYNNAARRCNVRTWAPIKDYGDGFVWVLSSPGLAGFTRVYSLLRFCTPFKSLQITSTTNIHLNNLDILHCMFLLIHLPNLPCYPLLLISIPLENLSWIYVCNKSFLICKTLIERIIHLFCQKRIRFRNCCKFP